MQKAIDSRGERDSDVYRRAFIDRRIFSKIRSDAGYTLSKSATFDLIISFCLEREIYDLCDVNDILEYFGEHLLGE
jgi:hypothetical protein